MYPSEDMIAAIEAAVADWSLADDQIKAALDADDVPNPAPQGTVDPVLYESELLALLTDPANGSVGKLLNWVNFSLVKADIEAQNAAGVVLWTQVLPGLGLVTTAEAQAITAKVTTPVPDPAWPATVTRIAASLGRPADIDDIAAARTAGGH